MVMNPTKSTPFFLLCFHSLFGCIRGYEELIAVQIRKIENRPEYAGCKWGIHAQNISDNTIVYENPGSNLFSVPASNNKLPNTYAAWVSLGSDYTFSTAIGAVQDTTSVNITICGANDPSLTSEQLQSAAAEIALVSNIKSAAAIRIRLDNSRGADTVFPGSWEWGDLMYDYGAIPGSLILDGNTVTVRVAPGTTVGKGLNVTVLSPGGGSECFEVSNQGITVSSSDGSGALGINTDFQVIDGSFSLVLTGSMALDSAPQDFTIACRDPLRRAVNVLSDALLSNGLTNIIPSEEPVVVNTEECQSAPTDDDSKSWSTIAEMSSETLDKLLNHTLLESDNTYAEAILRRQSSDGSISSGISNVKSTLSSASLDLNMAAYSTVDGSGLSRHDLVTPNFLSTLMAIADEDYIHLLPLAGETGTLSDRFVGTVAQGILYAKTGTMSNVNALSGRVGDVAFSILSDSCPQSSSVVRQGIDDIAVLFAELTL